MFAWALAQFSGSGSRAHLTSSRRPINDERMATETVHRPHRHVVAPTATARRGTDGTGTSWHRRHRHVVAPTAPARRGTDGTGTSWHRRHRHVVAPTAPARRGTDGTGTSWHRRHRHVVAPTAPARRGTDGTGTSWHRRHRPVVAPTAPARRGTDGTGTSWHRRHRPVVAPTAPARRGTDGTGTSSHRRHRHVVAPTAPARRGTDGTGTSSHRRHRHVVAPTAPARRGTDGTGTSWHRRIRAKRPSSSATLSMPQNWIFIKVDRKPVAPIRQQKTKLASYMRESATTSSARDPLVQPWPACFGLCQDGQAPIGQWSNHLRHVQRRVMMTMENPPRVAMVIFTFVDVHLNNSHVDYDRVVCLRR